MTMNRRDALGLLGSISALPLLGRPGFSELARSMSGVPQGQQSPSIAPGTPSSPERTALIEAFKTRSAGIERAFEARTFKSDWSMPYRIFAPKATGRLPLVVYLHGSGGLGTDNEKQMGLGNVFGTRVWALPENQKEFPCFVLAPQTDRGWVRYGAPSAGDSVARVAPGLGDGARVAFELIDALRRELPIDAGRIYITGQSMGGAGVWHMTAQRPGFFAASVLCCGTQPADAAVASIKTPLWAFHGDADETVPVSVTRERIAAMRKAGAHPHYTEYAGVGHNVWQWAYTEPALLRWVFAQRSGR
jgi:predicted peptidase